MKPSCLDHQDRTSTVLSLTRWGLPFFGTAKSKRPSSACRSDQRSGSWRCDGTQGATYSSWFHQDRGQKTSAQLDSWDSRAIARDPCPKTVIGIDDPDTRAPAFVWTLLCHLSGEYGRWHALVVPSHPCFVPTINGLSCSSTASYSER